MSQHGPKTTLLMTSLTKNLQPSTKKIFFGVQTRRLAGPFEPSNSSLLNRRRCYGVGKATKNCWF